MCVITGVAICVVCSGKDKKVTVVDAVKLFNQFNMKKELEENAKAKMKVIRRKTDSVKNKLRMASGVKNEKEVEQLTNILNSMSDALDEEYNRSNEEISSLVWKRLNPLIDKYGKQHGTHLIIGANGMGSVLYMDEHYDVTDDVIQFVNKKYEEGS